MSGVVIVTGASRGLGFACVQPLLSQGITVISVSRTMGDLKLILLEKRIYPFNAKLVPIQGDVCDEKTIQQIKLTFNSLNLPLVGLIANAGTIEPMAPIASVSLTAFQTHFQVNFFSILALLQCFMSDLRQTKGRIIMTSSGAVNHPYAGWCAYNTSKAAMNTLVETLAIEEPDLISVAVRPGVLDTAMQETIRLKGKEAMDPMKWEWFVQREKEGALMDPSVPAKVMVGLVLKAGKELNGRFVSWDDADVQQYKLMD